MSAVLKTKLYLKCIWEAFLIAMLNNSYPKCQIQKLKETALSLC